jgi:deazaflavin-dependent oxidoreductase (nitroreductase family)
MNLIYRLIISAHNAVYRASGGKQFNMGGTVLLLSTTGAKTGKTRTNPLCFVADGDTFLVGATAAGSDQHPAWYVNLRKNPNASIEINGKRVAVNARLVTEGEELTRLYTKLEAMEGTEFHLYQEKTTRIIPVVALTPARN